MSENSEQYYFNFSFFKVDPKWRWMADLAKEESAKEVENILKNSGITYRSYSNLGLREMIRTFYCGLQQRQLKKFKQ